MILIGVSGPLYSAWDRVQGLGFRVQGGSWWIGSVLRAQKALKPKLEPFEPTFLYGFCLES